MQILNKMEQVNHKKVIILTALKVLLMIAIFFTINNWDQVKQSFGGKIPELQRWLDNGLTLSNLILTALLSVVFYVNTLKQEKERVDGENSKE